MSITFREFVEILEGKKNKNKNRLPIPNVVDGTYQEDPDGSKTYTLKPAKPFKKPLSKKEISKQLEKQGGIGGGAVRRALKKREEQQEGFSYGSKSFQQELEKKREQEAKEKETQRQQNADSARRAFRHEGGMVSYEKDPKTGKIVRGRRTKNGFTPDT
jgi:hypothetical protein